MKCRHFVAVGGTLFSPNWLIFYFIFKSSRTMEPSVILHAGGRIDLVGRFDFESFLLAWVLFASSTNFMSVEKT